MGPECPQLPVRCHLIASFLHFSERDFKPVAFQRKGFRPMSSDTQSGNLLGRAGEFAMLGVGFAFIPLFLVVAPRWVIAGFNEGNQANLDTAQNKDYFDQIRKASHDDKAERVEMRKLIKELCEADDWDILAARIADWDQSRSATAAGTRHADMALDVLRKHLADEVFEPDMCNFDRYYLIGDGAFARLQAAYDTDPDNYVLTALLAQVHIDRGWVARGGGWSHEVTQEGWEQLTRSFQMAYALLNRFDPRDISSPLFARIRFQLLATEDPGVEDVREAYREWSDLDISSPQPHRNFAFQVLPRWFGDYETLEREAQMASERTKSVAGDAAYATIYLTALDYEQDALDLMDLEKFERGLIDLARSDPDPARRASELICEVQDFCDTGIPLIWHEITRRTRLRKAKALRGVIRVLAERFVTHLPTEGRRGQEKRLLRALSNVYDKELSKGMELDFTPDGIRLVAPDASKS
jgi:hypothetical protein